MVFFFTGSALPVYVAKSAFFVFLYFCCFLFCCVLIVTTLFLPKAAVLLYIAWVGFGALVRKAARYKQ